MPDPETVRAQTRERVRRHRQRQAATSAAKSDPANRWFEGEARSTPDGGGEAVTERYGTVTEPDPGADPATPGTPAEPAVGSRGATPVAAEAPQPPEAKPRRRTTTWGWPEPSLVVERSMSFPPELRYVYDTYRRTYPWYAKPFNAWVLAWVLKGWRSVDMKPQVSMGPEDDDEDGAFRIGEYLQALVDDWPEEDRSA